MDNPLNLQLQVGAHRVSTLRNKAIHMQVLQSDRAWTTASSAQTEHDPVYPKPKGKASAVQRPQYTHFERLSVDVQL